MAVWQEKSSCLVLLEVNLLLSIFAIFKHKNEIKILVCSEKTCESWAVIAKVTSTFTQIHKTSSQRFGAVHTPARFRLSSQFRHQFSCCFTAYGTFPSHTHTHTHTSMWTYRPLHRRRTVSSTKGPEQHVMSAVCD